LHVNQKERGLKITDKAKGVILNYFATRERDRMYLHTIYSIPGDFIFKMIQINIKLSFLMNIFIYLFYFI